jgi:hypothetical protein
MTTFTRIPEDETPSIHVDVSRRLSKIGKISSGTYLQASIDNSLTICIDPNIYGGFTEYVSISLLVMNLPSLWFGSMPRSKVWPGSFPTLFLYLKTSHFLFWGDSCIKRKILEGEKLSSNSN